jgi:hypothetical protein
VSHSFHYHTCPTYVQISFVKKVNS